MSTRTIPPDFSLVIGIPVLRPFQQRRTRLGFKATAGKYAKDKNQPEHHNRTEQSHSQYFLGAESTNFETCTHKKARHHCRAPLTILCSAPLAPAPMAGIPPVTSRSMSPMAAIPDPSRIRRQRPMTADGHITTAAPFPVFVNPDVTGTRSNRPYDRMPCGTNGYIDLGAGLDRSCTDDQHNEKCQFYHFRFTHVHNGFFSGVRDCFAIHKLVFKLKHWIALK